MRWLQFHKHKARQSRFFVSHQPLTRLACGWVVIIHYLLLTNAIYTWQIYSSTAIKSGRVIVRKAINNDSWGGRSQRMRALMRNNKSSLPGLTIVTLFLVKGWSLGIIKLKQLYWLVKGHMTCVLWPQPSTRWMFSRSFVPSTLTITRWDGTSPLTWVPTSPRTSLRATWDTSKRSRSLLYSFMVSWGLYFVA